MVDPQEWLSTHSKYNACIFSLNPPDLHPCRALGRKPSWVTDLAQALLRAQDANVVVVDWIYGASFAYNLVVQNYKEVALQISVLINQLQVRETIFYSRCWCQINEKGMRPAWETIVNLFQKVF